MLSADPTVASQQRRLEDWADESFLFYFMKYRRMVEPGELPTRSEGALQGEPEGRIGPLARFAAWLRAGGTWEQPHTGLLREVGDRMDDLINLLGARPFFYSDRLSMADLSVYAMLHTMRMDAIPGSAPALGQRPPLAAFMMRVEQKTGG